jgi:hypothetical protein
MNSAESKAGGAEPVPYTPGVIPQQRIEFWADTCREVTHMQHADSRQVIELYREYGCRFFEPGLEQVLSVLQALDSAVPAWEKAHPELFYQTLELNFPELVRRPC